MSASDDQSSTFSAAETASVITTSSEVFPDPNQTAIPPSSTIEVDQTTLPVTTTLELTPEAVATPKAIESNWGLSVRDCWALLVLSVGCVGLSVWQWGQISGWGKLPVEVQRLPERVYDYRIDINQATWAELMQLPGVGKTLAGRILEYRENHGPLENLDQLDNVKGIGPKTLQKLKPWLIVRDPQSEPQTQKP